MNTKTVAILGVMLYVGLFIWGPHFINDQSTAIDMAVAMAVPPLALLCWMVYRFHRWQQQFHAKMKQEGIW